MPTGNVLQVAAADSPPTVLDSATSGLATLINHSSTSFTTNLPAFTGFADPVTSQALVPLSCVFTQPSPFIVAPGSLETRKKLGLRGEFQRVKSDTTDRSTNSNMNNATLYWSTT